MALYRFLVSKEMGIRRKKTHGAPWTSIHSAVGDRLFLLSSSKKLTKSVLLLKGLSLMVNDGMSLANMT